MKDEDVKIAGDLCQHNVHAKFVRNFLLFKI